jgi:hypothetical protein
MASSFEIAELETFIRDELIYLWGQLWDAYGHYLDGYWMGAHPKSWADGGVQWSGRCEGLGERIAAATALVGPVSWRDIPMTALVDGWFNWANDRLGITPELPGEDDLARMRDHLMNEVQRAEP